MDMKSAKGKKIAVIGLGYVGLPLAILASKKGYDVYGIVRSEEKAKTINEKKSPIADSRIETSLLSANILAGTDFSVVSGVSIIVICVPTPVHHDYTPDLEPVISSSTSIGKNLKKGQLVILESTVNPGVCETIVVPILEKESGFEAGKDFFVAHCPERINPGDSQWNVENIPRVIGSLEQKGLKKAVKFYRSILTGMVTEMSSIKEAEAVKITENAFRDINIAFVNELALSFDRLGIDVLNVIHGASTKPFSFLPHYPGCGVGGHCIPVDPYYLIAYAKQFGFSHNFLSLARSINNAMPKRTVGYVVKSLQKISRKTRGSKVAVLGLSYKANIDDDRESPSYQIIKELEKRGIVVSTFDPNLPGKSTCTSLEAAVRGVHAVIIATAHKAFVKLNPEFYLQRNITIVIDGRNCLDKKKFVAAGIIYKGIGR